MIKFHEINGFNSGTSRAAVTDNYVMMVAIAHAQEKTLREKYLSNVSSKYKIHGTIYSETRLVIYSNFYLLLRPLQNLHFFSSLST